MTIEQFRARYFNPEMWVRTGLLWAVLTLMFMSAIELLRDGALRDHDWAIRLPVFATAGLLFGLLLRHVSRREVSDAR